MGTEYSQALLLGLNLYPFAISLVFAAAGGAGWLLTVWSGRLRPSARKRLLRVALWGYPVAPGVAAATPGAAWALSCATGGVVLGRGSGGAASMLLEQTIIV